MKLIRKRAFTDSSVIKNPLCSAGDAGSVPGQGTKIPHAAWHGKKKKKTYW